MEIFLLTETILYLVSNQIEVSQTIFVAAQLKILRLRINSTLHVAK